MGVIAAVTLGVLFIKTLFGWALLSLGGEPVGRALVSSLVTPQIGEFSFVLTTSGVALGIFTGFEADFLLAVIVYITDLEWRAALSGGAVPDP